VTEIVEEVTNQLEFLHQPLQQFLRLRRRPECPRFRQFQQRLQLPLVGQLQQFLHPQCLRFRQFRQFRQRLQPPLVGQSLQFLHRQCQQWQLYR
jgi:hypothetical protein